MLLDELKYRSWALGRQLKPIYLSLQLETALVSEARSEDKKRRKKKKEEEEEEDDDDGPVQEQLVRLRTKESALRKQIGHLVVKLPATSKAGQPQTDDEALGGVGGRASEALRRFLVSNGGERGGWAERDHSLFLQWRSRFRNNRQTFVSAVCDTVPGKTAAQVEAHERFYQELLRLRNEQRLELDEWKRNKKMQEEEERKRIRQQYNETPQEIDRWLTDWKRQRKVIEEKIDRWKTEKAAAAAAAAAQVVVQPTPSQVRKAQLDQKRRMEQQYQRLVAYLWKVEQEAVAEGVRHFVEKKKKKRRSASCHQLLREKQQQVEKQWIEKTRRRPTPTPPHTRPPSSTSSSVASRDPKRLFKPTSASIARQLPDPSAEDHQEFIRCPPTKPYILDISSRTVPTWRRPSAGS